MIRPEGIYYAGIAFVATFAAGRTRHRAFTHCALGLVSVVVVVTAHALWRHSYYGAWVPNTFHAKVGFTAAQAARGAGQTLDFIRGGGGFLFLPLAAAPFAIWSARVDGCSWPGL